MDKTNDSYVNVDFAKLLQNAEVISTETLKDGRWHTDAFLSLCMVKLIQGMNVDIPGTNIDNCINDLDDLFTTYYNDKSVNTLKPLLLKIQQILSELYDTCENEDEKQEITNFIENISKIP